jgi:xanthine dehydrogenase accessory factor
VSRAARDRRSNEPLVAVGEPRESVEIEAYAEFARLAAEGQPTALVTVVGTEGSAPRGMGAAMTVRADGSIVGTVGGGNLELAMIRHALEAMGDGLPRRYSFDYSGGPAQNLVKACIGKTELFVQPSPVPPKLVVFGAGHIGVALAPIAQSAGFRVTVVDDRPEYADPARFPAGVRVIAAPFVDCTRSLEFDASTFAVILTFGHEQDQAVLAACLHRPWRYLGMIGSPAKVARVFRAVGTDLASRRRLRDVRAPIGLDLGGRSPAEIAIAIAAELVAFRYGREEIQPMRASRTRRKKERRDGAR